MSLTAFENLDESENLSADEAEETFDDVADAEDALVTTQPTSAIASNKIKRVTVTFTKAIRDVNRRVMPFGTAVATYGDGTQLSVAVTGGAHVPTYGITDAVLNHAVTRKGGAGYKNHKGQPMPYSVFYNRGEALHVGRLDLISHGCVHVGDTAKMKKINLDSVIGITKVSVYYGAGVLDKIWNQHM